MLPLPSRPLAIGVVLLVLFLTLSRDRGMPRGDSLARGVSRTADLRPGVKEKIIYELSLDNEKLAREVQQLKQYVLDVRRAARGCGCPLNDTVLTLFPELQANISEATAAAAAAARAAGGREQADAAGGSEGAAAGSLDSSSGSTNAAIGSAATAARGEGGQTGLAAGGALAAGARRKMAQAGSGPGRRGGRLLLPGG